MNVPAASARGLTKQFGATHALDGVDFDVQAAEVHALVGENGAGKSTLVRLLSGVHRPDQGEIAVDGTVRRFNGPRDAITAGVITIPQELRLVSALSVAENLTLGDPPLRRVAGLNIIDRARMRKVARDELGQLDFAPDPDIRVDRLSFAERQLIAIARALRRQCRVLILDEPTAALETREIERLFALLARMKDQGTAIIYVSHRLDEIVELADRCTVLRDGRVATTSRRGSFNVTDLVAAMTGGAAAKGEGIFPSPFLGSADQPEQAPHAALLEDVVERPDAIRLRAGEVTGLAGLLGSGASGILRRLFGIGAETSSVRRDGMVRRIAGPADAVRAGIGFVPGERRLGLIMNLSARDNILLPSLGRLTRGQGGGIDRVRADRLVTQLMELLDIRPREPRLPASAFSGGNQQKIILAKWLAREVGVLLLEEPTQGVDVAAKAQIHRLIRGFAERGGGVLLRSSDFAELTLVCDAILAVHRGRITDRVPRADGFDETRLHTAIGA
ncbi:MAG: sugar ABC transporter ATP-binding protein [Xanthobacteraceae bacterium]|jgi:ABC-type sugar transport system ATPase subunit